MEFKDPKTFIKIFTENPETHPPDKSTFFIRGGDTLGDDQNQGLYLVSCERRGDVYYCRDDVEFKAIDLAHGAPYILEDDVEKYLTCLLYQKEHPTTKEGK